MSGASREPPRRDEGGSVERRTAAQAERRRAGKIERERAFRLQLLADVGRRTTAILSLPELLHSSVQIIQETFPKVITLKNFYHRHNVRRPERIQSRLDLLRSARLLTRDAAVIDFVRKHTSSAAVSPVRDVALFRDVAGKVRSSAKLLTGIGIVMMMIFYLIGELIMLHQISIIIQDLIYTDTFIQVTV